MSITPGPSDFRGGSIRRALALWLSLPLLALVPLATGLLYALAVGPAKDSLDHALAGTALAVSAMVRSDGQGVHAELSAQTDLALRADRFDKVFYVVIDPAGRSIAGDADLRDVGAPASSGEWQFFDAMLGGVPVRVAARTAPCGVDAPADAPVCQVRVAETTIKRVDAERAVLAGSVISIVSVALLMGLMGWRAISVGLRPLEQLSAEIESRSLGNLNPVHDVLIPREVAPLVVALNRLFERVRAAAIAERAFLADAAHQLRTPLTALRTEAELALIEPHPAQVEALLTRLHQGATRAARLAHQLLSQARADHEAHTAPLEALDLKRLVTESVEEGVGRSLDAGIDLGFELQTATVMARGYLLRELLANLLDNALQYAGPGAHVTVRTYTRGELAVLEVDDSGPGISPADRARVMERFQRGAQDRGVGSGLGLSIVRDVAQHHQARVELLDGSTGVGLMVRVSLPLHKGL